jgi:hypothetical protein
MASMIFFAILATLKHLYAKNLMKDDVIKQLLKDEYSYFLTRKAFTTPQYKVLHQQASVTDDYFNQKYNNYEFITPEYALDPCHYYFVMQKDQITLQSLLIIEQFMVVGRAYTNDYLLDLSTDERELLFKLAVFFLNDFIKVDPTVQLCAACVGILTKIL